VIPFVSLCVSLLSQEFLLAQTPAVSPETTTCLSPRWDAAGLITAVCTDAATGELLMVAHMNAEALAATQESGHATFWSRSRQKLWMKGESSGHVLDLVEMRIDCDQDCLWLKCTPRGPACHTGEASCFYRVVQGDTLVTS
jgi:phosphoribosyl-AMP cyclohydrolase